MSRYRKVPVRMWDDGAFRSLSPLQPSGQALWLFLWHGPYTTVLPGVSLAGPAALAEALSWDRGALDAAFAELAATGQGAADWRVRLVFLPRALDENPPANPKVVVAWRRAFDELPECQLKVEIGSRIEQIVHALGESWLTAWTNGKAPEPPKSRETEGIGKGIEKGSGKGIGTQKQKQTPEAVEQKQTQNASSTPRPGHKGHVFCGNRACVPHFLHDEFLRQIGTASVDLTAWYREQNAQLGNVPLASDPLTFWRKAFARHVRPQLQRQGGTGGTTNPMERMHERGRSAIRAAPIAKRTFTKDREITEGQS